MVSGLSAALARTPARPPAYTVLTHLHGAGLLRVGKWILPFKSNSVIHLNPIQSSISIQFSHPSQSNSVFHFNPIQSSISVQFSHPFQSNSVQFSPFPSSSIPIQNRSLKRSCAHSWSCWIGFNAFRQVFSYYPSRETIETELRLFVAKMEAEVHKRLKPAGAK